MNTRRFAETFVACLLLIGAPSGGGQTKETIYMSDTIAVELSSRQPVPLQAPVPVSVTLANHGPAPVSVLLPYPNPNNLQFRCSIQGFATAKAVEPDPIERTAPITIRSGQTYSVTYYLNRYLTFLKVGNGNIDYSLRMFVTSGAGNTSSRTETFSGRFAVQLTSASEEELRKVFATYSSQLRAPNRQSKTEAAEALAFVDTPLVVPYLQPMLQIDNLEVIGIHALARHSGRESQQAIRSMLNHPDSAVVSAALEEIDRIHVPISRNEVQQLLGSTNPNTEWLALGWLAARPSREDLPLVVPLLNSPNVPVRERARAYSDRLN